MTITGYGCWICGEAIDQYDTMAFRMTINSLWHDTEVDQEIYLHEQCAVEKIRGPKSWIEVDVFEDAAEEKYRKKP